MSQQDHSLFFDTAEEASHNLLKGCNLLEPPVNVVSICTQLKIDVVCNKNISHRAYTKKVRGKEIIIVRSEPRIERLHWAVAHELGEIFYARKSSEIFSKCGIEEMNSSTQISAREQWANHFATYLLIPSAFAQLASSLDYDLLELKQIYSTASHELIAQRMVQLCSGSMLTVLDQGKISRRYSHQGQHSQQLSPLERDIWLKSHLTGLHEKSANGERSAEGGIKIFCWAIHEPGWKREIIFTRIEHEFDDY